MTCIRGIQVPEPIYNKLYTEYCFTRDVCASMSANRYAVADPRDTDIQINSPALLRTEDFMLGIILSRLRRYTTQEVGDLDTMFMKVSTLNVQFGED